MPDKGNCVMCGKPLRGRQKMYCSRACKNKDLQSYQAQQRRGLRRKRRLIDEAGGRCTICGYRENLAALVFHHTEYTGKDFKLDMRSLSNRRFEAVRLEVDKCVLVCANCHARLHNPNLDLE